MASAPTPRSGARTGDPAYRDGARLWAPPRPLPPPANDNTVPLRLRLRRAIQLVIAIAALVGIVAALT